MIQDWKPTAGLQDHYEFVRGPGQVRPSTLVPGGYTAVYNDKPCGVFWDELQPALGCQMAMGCVERRYWAMESTAEGVPAYEPQ